MIGEQGPDTWRTDAAWIDPPSGSCVQTIADGILPFFSLTGLIRRVAESGMGELTSELESLRAAERESLASGSSAAVQPAGLGFEPSSALVVPLRGRGQTLGTMSIVRGKDRPPLGPAELTLAEDLAGRAAIAIDNARLYRDVQENDRRKNEFLAMLAHELRNPLAPIRSAVEILLMRELGDQDLRFAGDVISRQVDHLVRLVDDLLDISRITGGKIQLRIETVDVSNAVARAVETSRPLIDAPQARALGFAAAGAAVRERRPGSPAQVLANLMNNAAKYTEAGGKISLSVARAGGEAVFRVRDNGIGIAPERLSCVFDLFSQGDHSLDRSLGGLGVGLTVVRQLGRDARRQRPGQKRRREPGKRVRHSDACARGSRPPG